MAAQSGGAEKLECKSEWRCNIRYHRHYTPLLMYLNPPVNYYEQEIEINFNPKSMMHKIKDLASDELAFISTHIGGALIDFNGYVNYETSITTSWS
jgi:hypothetical protein